MNTSAISPAGLNSTYNPRKRGLASVPTSQGTPESALQVEPLGRMAHHPAFGAVSKTAATASSRV
jgi:hypothetical protein